MLHSVLISTSIGVLIVAAWYWAFRLVNRRRAVIILRWLDGAVAAHGRISGVEWISASSFRARLRLPGSSFRQPFLEARLAPREMPVRWALWGWHHRQETLIFHANLSCPPSRSMEIGRTRWTGLSRRWMRNTANWPTQTVTSVLISTQPDWKPEISGHMTTMVAARELEFLGVSFQPRPPHFSVTFSLRDAMEHPRGELSVFDSLRELAESSPTSRM